MKLEAINTKESTWKPKEIEAIIFPPSWNENIKDFQKDNWQNKKLLLYTYKYLNDFWNYMKENNIIPKAIEEEIENTTNIEIFNLL